MDNKEIIKKIYAEVFNEHNLSITKDFIREDYIQHNPRVENGREGFDRFFKDMYTKFPGFRIDIKHIVAEGDYVVVHTHATGANLERGAAVVDIYRLENSKLAEHWDVIQPVPENSVNGNTMF